MGVERAMPPTLSVPALESKKYKFWKWAALLLATLIFFAPMGFSYYSGWIHLESVNPQIDKTFRGFLGLFQKGDADKINSLLSPEAKSDADGKLGQLIQTIQQEGEVVDSRLLSLKVDGGKTQLVYYVDFEKGSVLFDFIFRPAGEGNQVEKFSIQVEDQTFQRLCAFPFDMSVICYLFMFAAWGLILLNAHTLVRCCFTPLKWKWLWILFILFGIGDFTIICQGVESLNISRLEIGMPVAQIVKNPLLNPWKIVLTIPVGMIVFLLKHRKPREKA